ncbi:unnamed protein product [Brugia timori]|uniref:PH domain-containing protein n=1 Tax=Brugia timori TaxID=42155 RepID=A0A0R3QM30_9BILA|nr:unnamed protein product [Brugia timori]
MDGAVFSLDVKTVWHRWWKQLRSFYKIKRIFHDIAKRQIIYHEDGRRFVGDKIENEQSVSSLWSTALTRSVAQDLKDRSNEDFTVSKKYSKTHLFPVSHLLQQIVSQRNVRTTFILIALNIALILLFLYIFVF